jgi:ribosome-associated toxin RatA of RatAB toxin-antitoxin module
MPVYNFEQVSVIFPHFIIHICVAMQVMAMRNTSKYDVSVVVQFGKLCSNFETPVTVRLKHYFQLESRRSTEW